MTEGLLELVGLWQAVAEELDQEREGTAEDEAEHERDRGVQRQVSRYR